ncbi:hypothetical protein [Undibacterium macrobrachii]|uniref:Uncharacterized protein n=1 Tax=Undibacterium macrobrachii TaxID=1119058 RepID=A0ABQ2XB05_9BURK|nr:hypothetical protein [Undibacterium macrobrachii]GGX08572.1 hypothetical protein GCM10011282_13370 [Undibacterium macrobrachii]
MKIYTSHIYELTDWNPPKNAEFVPYREVFRKSIQDDMDICKLPTSSDHEVHIIRFFKSIKQAMRTMAIVSFIAEEASTKEQAEEIIRKHAGSKAGSRKSGQIWVNGELEEMRLKASQFLRNSNALTASSFESQNNLRFVADGLGFAIIDTTKIYNFNEEEYFQRPARVSRVSCLAHAYLSVLDDVIERLGDAVKQNGTNAEKELKRWSEFMTACYFAEPIKQSTNEVGPFFRAIRDRQMVTQFAVEVTEQLRLLAELIRIERNEQQATRDKKIQFRLTFVNILIAALALVQCTQVTPKVWSDFSQQWGDKFAGSNNANKVEQKDTNSTKREDSKKQTIKHKEKSKVTDTH